MFFGTRDAFTYFECGACGTVQIQHQPDLSPYYPANYYSFVTASPSSQRPNGLGKRLAHEVGAIIRKKAADYYCAKPSRRAMQRKLLDGLNVGKLKRVVVGFPEYLKLTNLDLHLTRRSSILDVGSGAGILLQDLQHFGFRDLTGVDPFIESNCLTRTGVRMLKAQLSDIDRQFDLILANHSLEHVPDPAFTLKCINNLLKQDHYAVVRIPILAYAWEAYGTDWVQLDPPRHIHIFSEATFIKLAENTGFRVEDVTYDSTAFQFWGSEQYKSDIPLMNDRSYFTSPEKSIFTSEQLEDFNARAADLNKRRNGDQAVFYLRKETRTRS
jgi:2-polyprenyl-3-methyl-5-hydroxy-6-metoxy-1,4-benzoquinol methylase